MFRHMAIYQPITKLFAASEIEKTPKRCTNCIGRRYSFFFSEIRDNVVIAQIEKCKKKKSTNEFFKISFFPNSGA